MLQAKLKSFYRVEHLSTRQLDFTCFPCVSLANGGNSKDIIFAPLQTEACFLFERTAGLGCSKAD